MAANPSPAKITFAEYLDRERVATHRSEYRRGEVFAMAAGIPSHAELSMRLGFLLKTTGCRVFSSDLKVFAKATNEAMHPDVSVACEELQFYDEIKDVILNPTIVVEVLSPSTREYDLSLKASFYRSIPSLKTLSWSTQNDTTFNVKPAPATPGNSMNSPKTINSSFNPKIVTSPSLTSTPLSSLCRIGIPTLG